MAAMFRASGETSRVASYGARQVEARKLTVMRLFSLCRRLDGPAATGTERGT
jgi:hypothetical protein